MAIGGRFPALTGFALWQVQIYSNQIYSKVQIEEDKASARAGKSLWLQESFQRYNRCAGSLTKPYVVLTAAHCVAKPPVDGVTVLNTREVLVGTQELRSGGTAYKISSVIVDAGYKPNSQKDDIALVRIVPKSKAVMQQTVGLVGTQMLCRATNGTSRHVKGCSLQIIYHALLTSKCSTFLLLRLFIFCGNRY